MMKETKHRLVLMVITLMFCAIRFAHVYVDSLQYILYSEVLLSGDLSSITGPFVYRPLIPILTVFLKESANIVLAMSIINVGILCVITDCVYHICGTLTLNKNMKLLGAAVTAASYPLVFFGPVPLVDAAAMLIFVYIIAAAECNYGDEAAAFVIFIGVFVKEIILILGLYYAIRLGWKKLWVMVPAGVGHLCLRMLLPRENTLIFTLNILERPIEVLGMFAITFTIPIMIILILHFRGDFATLRGDRILIAGVLASLPLIIMGLFFAYFDGRFIWPVLIVLGMYISSMRG